MTQMDGNVPNFSGITKGREVHFVILPGYLILLLAYILTCRTTHPPWFPIYSYKVMHLMVIFVNLLENIVQETYCNSHHHYNLSWEQKACNKLPNMLSLRMQSQY